MARARSSTTTESIVTGARETERVARELHEAAVKREKDAAKKVAAVQQRADEIGRALLTAIQSPPPRPVNPSTPGTVMFLEPEPDAAMQRAAEEVTAEYERCDAELAAARDDVPVTRDAWFSARRARRVAELLATDDTPATVRDAHTARAAAREELTSADTARTQALAALERYRGTVDSGAPRDPVRRLELEAGIADAEDRVTVATHRVAVTTDEYRDAVTEYLSIAVIEHRRARRIAEDTAVAVAAEGLRDLLAKVSAGVQVGNEHSRRLAALRDDAQIRPDSLGGPEGPIDAVRLLRDAVSAL